MRKPQILLRCFHPIQPLDFNFCCNSQIKLPSLISGANPHQATTFDYGVQRPMCWWNQHVYQWDILDRFAFTTHMWCWFHPMFFWSNLIIAGDIHIFHWWNPFNLIFLRLQPAFWQGESHFCIHEFIVNSAIPLKIIMCPKEIQPFPRLTSIFSHWHGSG